MTAISKCNNELRFAVGCASTSLQTQSWHVGICKGIQDYEMNIQFCSHLFFNNKKGRKK